MDIYKYFIDKFELFKKEEYRSCDLSDESKKILCDIGLPNKPLNFLEFNIETVENIQLGSEYIVIGNDYGTSICINKQNQIVSIDPEDEYPTRFVNKDLKSLLQFIKVYLLYESKLLDVNDDEVNKIIEEIKKEFGEIDAEALNNEENWWSLILEQVELGLM